MGNERTNRKLLEFDDELNLERYDKIQEFKWNDKKKYFQAEVYWSNVLILFLLHVFMIYTFITFPYVQKWRTALFFFIYTILSVVGVMVFGHRYCSHKSFKANVPLKIIMMMMYAASGSYSAFTWAIDHRVHHKYTDTMADPYNPSRGFFFSHIGWLMMKKSPEYSRRARQIDMNDFKNDTIIMFFERNYRTFYLIFTYLIPTFITCYFWQEAFYHSVSLNIARYLVGINCVWSINSFSHHFGDKPYDSKSSAVENLFIAIIACGEGWHNYHHKFPWDYRASEKGKINLAGSFIELFAKIGWAYDLKEVSPELLKRVLENQANDPLRDSKEYDYKF